MKKSEDLDRQHPTHCSATLVTLFSIGRQHPSHWSHWLATPFVFVGCTLHIGWQHPTHWSATPYALVSNTFHTGQQHHHTGHQHLDIGQQHLEIGRLHLHIGWQHLHIGQQQPSHWSARAFILVSNTFACLLYTSPSPRDMYKSRMPSSA